MSLRFCKICDNYDCTNVQHNFIYKHDNNVDSVDSKSVMSDLNSVNSSCIISTNSSKSSYVCNNCESEFKNKHTLNLHQKTSDKCSNQDVSNEYNKTCDYCKKIFSSKQMKKYHESKCIDKITISIMKEYETKLNNLENYYKDIIKKLKTGK